MDDADGMEEGKEVIRPAIVFSSQALDGITFAMAVGVWGIAGEANPVVSLIYGATGLPGVCAAGTMTCQAGTQVCVPDVPSSAEVCDDPHTRPPVSRYTMRSLGRDAAACTQVTAPAMGKALDGK